MYTHRYVPIHWYHSLLRPSHRHLVQTFRSGQPCRWISQRHFPNTRWRYRWDLQRLGDCNPHAVNEIRRVNNSHVSIHINWGAIRTLMLSKKSVMLAFTHLLRHRPSHTDRHFIYKGSCGKTRNRETAMKLRLLFQVPMITRPFWAGVNLWLY